MEISGVRSYAFSGADLARLCVRQSIAIVTVGRFGGGELYVLPIARFRQAVYDTYGEKRVNQSPRLNTSTNVGGMQEPELLKVLNSQVGVDGHISGGEVRIVTLNREDAAYLVPVNRYWKRLVQSGSSG